ncbi:MAG: VWA domain-containing protein [Bacteroidales bacterium]|nr:VWA domain-containing protein [Bacteroidales bacterium]
MKLPKSTVIRSFVLMMLLSCVSSLWAQRERNYIYILDCSRSMVTEYHIWDATLDYLEKDIARLSDNTMVTIVPFQGTVYGKSVKHELKKDFDWAKFKKEVYRYPDALTGTNICQAWDHAQSYIDPNKDNYIYLLTDGKDNKNPSPDGTENVCKRIRQWCERAGNSQGYYVALSNEAIDDRIRTAVEHCPKFKTVNGIQNPFGSFDKIEMNYNTLDPHDAILPFSAEGNFKASAQSADSSIGVTLAGGIIQQGRATFHFTPNVGISQMPQSFDVPIKVTSDEIDILNPDLILHVKNIAERSLLLPTEEIDLGEAEWYGSFWWSDAKAQDTLTFDLNPQFNESASKMGAHIQLRFSETTTDKDKPLGLQCQLLFNGEPSDGNLNIDPGQPAVLSIIPNTDSREGKHYYQLISVPSSKRNLENINGEPVSDYQLTLRSSYDVDMNPLKWAVIIICAIILALLIVWFLIMRPLLYPTIRLSSIQMECQPIYKNPRIKGCRRVVFSNRRRQQSLLNRIFTGEVKYITEDFWDKEWSLVPGSKKTRVRALGVSGYAMNPPGNTIEALTPVEMKSLATGKKIKITLKK